MRNRIDWVKVVAAVCAAGITQRDAAERCGMTQPAVSRLAAGHTADPPYSSGNAFLALFAVVCAGQDVPMGPELDHAANDRLRESVDPA